MNDEHRSGRQARAAPPAQEAPGLWPLGAAGQAAGGHPALPCSALAPEASLWSAPRAAFVSHH